MKHLTIRYYQTLFTIVLVSTFWVQIDVDAENFEDTSQTNYVLLTGFEPFYIYSENPSQLIVESLNGTFLGNASIIGIVLPVNFSASVSQITQAIDTYDPLMVISLGLNGEARMIQVENIGLNLRNRPRSDPWWFFPKRLDSTGPFILKATIPTTDIALAIRDGGISARQSYHAGTYVCNAVFYQTLRFIEVEDKGISMGFIHVPPLDYQEPYGMNLSVLVDAVSIAISTAVDGVV